MGHDGLRNFCFQRCRLALVGEITDKKNDGYGQDKPIKPFFPEKFPPGLIG
jgi:hypothetical protein